MSKIIIAAINHGGWNFGEGQLVACTSNTAVIEFPHGIKVYHAEKVLDSYLKTGEAYASIDDEHKAVIWPMKAYEIKGHCLVISDLVV